MAKTLVAGSQIHLDPLAREPIEVEIPDGWYRVLHGALKPGDLSIDKYLLWEDKIVRWVEFDTDAEMERMRQHRITDAADVMVCVIREGTPVDEPCERCKIWGRKRGYRFCEGCCGIIRDELRGTLE